MTGLEIVNDIVGKNKSWQDEFFKISNITKGDSHSIYIYKLESTSDEKSIHFLVDFFSELFKKLGMKLASFEEKYSLIISIADKNSVVWYISLIGCAKYIKQIFESEKFLNYSKVIKEDFFILASKDWFSALDLSLYFGLYQNKDSTFYYKLTFSFDCKDTGSNCCAISIPQKDDITWIFDLMPDNKTLLYLFNFFNTHEILEPNYSIIKKKFESMSESFKLQYALEYED